MFYRFLELLIEINRNERFSVFRCPYSALVLLILFLICRDVARCEYRATCLTTVLLRNVVVVRRCKVSSIRGSERNSSKILTIMGMESNK